MKIKLISKDLHEVEYVIKEKRTKKGNRKMVLKTSKSESWVECSKNEKQIELIDDGNDYTIKIPGKDHIVLDASELNVLHLIIDNYIKETDDFSSGYKRVVKK